MVPLDLDRRDFRQVLLGQVLPIELDEEEFAGLPAGSRLLADDVALLLSEVITIIEFDPSVAGRGILQPVGALASSAAARSCAASATMRNSSTGLRASSVPAARAEAGAGDAGTLMGISLRKTISLS